MNQKELSEFVCIQQLCEEHGFGNVLDRVRAALECHLYSLQEQIDHIPGKSPSEQAESRTWKCPECDHSVELTYDELADCGFPRCAECEIGLER